jgi:hypothetical protein
MEPLINMEQAAALLGLTKAQLYELTRTREIAKLFQSRSCDSASERCFVRRALTDGSLKWRKIFPLLNRRPLLGKASFTLTFRTFHFDNLCHDYCDDAWRLVEHPQVLFPRPCQTSLG